MKRKVFSLMMLCLFAYLGMANAQVSPRDKGGITITPNPVEMGYRPNGAWMRPFEAQLTNSGAAETVTAIETTNEDFFIIDANLPAVVNSTKPLNFTIDNPDGVEKGVRAIKVNGESVPVGPLPLTADKEVNVEITMG